MRARDTRWLRVKLDMLARASGDAFDCAMPPDGGIQRVPGMVAAFILSLVLSWNEYFFAALLTSSYANTLPVMVALPVAEIVDADSVVTATSLSVISPIDTSRGLRTVRGIPSVPFTKPMLFPC
jgi:hypothetical protein